MIFSYLKYISPIWYFNLRPLKDWSYFPCTEQIESAGLPFSPDPAYRSEEARQRDSAYRAFQIGYIEFQGKGKGLDVWKKEKLPAEDEYRFLRKNVHVFWVMYTLVMRVFTFNNPFKEVLGYVRSRDAQREDYAAQAIRYDDYETFSSALIESKPLVSVVIPTLNRYPYLKDVFRDLEKQTYINFEVIVVDQSEPFDETVYQGWKLNLIYWQQKEKALWKARNDAIQAAKGEWILLYDDDSLVEPDWIEEHLKTIDYFNADLSSGVSISTVGAKVPAHYAYFRWSDQLDTGNVLLKKEVFRQIGLFDRNFEGQRMGDGEFGLRAYLAGFRNVSNPKAKRVHLKVGSGGLRQMGSWDGWRPKKWWGARPIPSILYFYRKYFGNMATFQVILKNLPQSLVPYSFKGRSWFIFLLLPLSIFLSPLLFFQVLRSWNNASQLLKRGPQIDRLH